MEGIDRSYCDDFVCTSSPQVQEEGKPDSQVNPLLRCTECYNCLPQVEQNIKALARDMTRLSSWTMSLFRKDVSYKVRFQGLSFGQKPPLLEPDIQLCRTPFCRSKVQTNTSGCAL